MIKRPFTVGELKLFFSQFDKNNLWDYRYRLMFLVGVYMGFRRSQVVRLNEKNVYWKERFYFVKKDKTEAGNRPVPIPYEIYYHLKEYYNRFKEAIDESGGYFFYNENKHISEKQFYTKWCEYSKILDINVYQKSIDERKLKEMSLHSFRSFYAVYLLDHGINPFTVMELGGWKTFESMKPYIRMATREKKRAVFLAFDNEEIIKPTEPLRLCEDTPILEKTKENFQKIYIV